MFLTMNTVNIIYKAKIYIAMGLGTNIHYFKYVHNSYLFNYDNIFFFITIYNN